MEIFPAIIFDPPLVRIALQLESVFPLANLLVQVKTNFSVPDQAAEYSHY
jgi:hypothetical protein